MGKIKYEWRHEKGDSWNFYDVWIGKDYLCVSADKSNPGMWQGMYIKNGHGVIVMDKTFNDKQRKKEKDDGIAQGRYPGTIKNLSSSDVEKMKQKVEYAYANDLEEVSNR